MQFLRVMVGHVSERTGHQLSGPVAVDDPDLGQQSPWLPQFGHPSAARNFKTARPPCQNQCPVRNNGTPPEHHRTSPAPRIPDNTLKGCQCTGSCSRNHRHAACGSPCEYRSGLVRLMFTVGSQLAYLIFSVMFNCAAASVELCLPLCHHIATHFVEPRRLARVSH
jgi:hypothetical protein